MKNVAKMLIAVLAVSIFMGAMPAFAEETTTLKNVEMGGLKIFVHGDALLPVDANQNRVEPFIYNGTTYLPVRAVGNAFERRILWDQDTMTVTIGESFHHSWIQHATKPLIDDVERTEKVIKDLEGVVTSGVTVMIDGKKLEATDANGNPVEPLIYNGTTYLPLRAVAGALKEPVNWDGDEYNIWLGIRPTTGSNISTMDIKRVYDKFGNRYSTIADNRYGNSIHWVYTADKKHSKLRGTIYIPQGEEGSGEGYVSIQADGVFRYRSPVLTKDSEPIDFEVDITGFYYPTITFSGSGAKTLYMCAGNVEMIK